MRISIELLVPNTWEDEYGTHTETHYVQDTYPVPNVSDYYFISPYIHWDFLNPEVIHYPEVTIPETVYNEGTEWEYTEPEYTIPAYDVYVPVYVENSIDLLDTTKMESMFQRNSDKQRYEFALGKLNTLMSSFMYFPKNNKYDLLFGTERDTGLLIRNNEIGGIAGCDGVFFIETGTNTRIANNSSQMPFDFATYKSIGSSHNPRIEDTLSHYTSYNYSDIWNEMNIKNRFTNIDEFVSLFNGEGGDWI